MLCAVARQVTGKLSVTAIAPRNATAFCKPCCMAPVSACKGFSVWKYIRKAPITCLFGAVGWGADEAGHPFEEQTKKRPLRSALVAIKEGP